MQIYPDEQDIASLIQANKSIAYSSAIEKVEDSEIEYFQPKLKEFLSTANINDPQLFYHKSILVSTVINKNDDMFLPDVVWAAKDSPLHKPSNLDHNSTEIVGHICSSFGIDTDHKLIANDIKIEDLPEKFHILVGSVIYKPGDNFTDEENNY